MVLEVQEGISMNIVGFDFDDTITDQDAYLYEKFLIWHETVAKKGKYKGRYLRDKVNIESKFPDVPEYELKKFLDYYFPLSAKEAPLRNGVKEVFDTLKEEGYGIHIVTRRSTEQTGPYTGGMLKIDSIEYLRKHNLPYDRIHFNCTNKTKTMDAHKIGVLVDDNIGNIASVSTKYPVIIMDCPWNKKFNVSNTVRITEYKVDEFMGIIHAIFQ